MSLFLSFPYRTARSTKNVVRFEHFYIFINLFSNRINTLEADIMGYHGIGRTPVDIQGPPRPGPFIFRSEGMIRIWPPPPPHPVANRISALEHLSVIVLNITFLFFS